MVRIGPPYPGAELAHLENRPRRQEARRTKQEKITSMDPRTDTAVNWLLNSGEPAIRLMTRRDVLSDRADDDGGQVLTGAKVTALLSG
jgi:hypothetical protein